MTALEYVTKEDATGNPYKVKVRETSPGSAIYVEVTDLSDESASDLGAAIAAALPSGGGTAEGTTVDRTTLATIEAAFQTISGHETDDLASQQDVDDGTDVGFQLVSLQVSGKVNADGARAAVGATAAGGTVSGPVTLANNAPFQTFTLSGDTTFTMPATAQGTLVVVITQDGTGGWTPTFSPTVSWPSGATPVPGLPGQVDKYRFDYSGSAWFADAPQLAYS